jgi:hypothetical protein
MHCTLRFVRRFALTAIVLLSCCSRSVITPETPASPTSLTPEPGSDMSITGAMDPRWNNDELNPAFRALSASDFEVLRLGWR